MADSSGNDPQRPGQHRLAAGANTPMAKTVALVVVALIIGIVMINIVGDGGSTAKTSKTTTTTASASNSTTSTSSGTTKTSATTATTVKATPVTPATLSLVVLNAGAPPGSAANVARALRTGGYTKQQPATTASFHQPGLTVHCQPGLETARTALVHALDVPHYTAAAGSWKALTGTDAKVQCYVTIGTPS